MRYLQGVCRVLEVSAIIYPINMVLCLMIPTSSYPKLGTKQALEPKYHQSTRHILKGVKCLSTIVKTKGVGIVLFAFSYLP